MSKFHSLNTRRRGIFSFKLWHLLIFVTLASFLAYYLSVAGTQLAVFHVKEASVDHDEQWGKTWATLEYHIKEPEHLAGEKLEFFIEVDEDFTFAPYGQGDDLRFRYQHTEFYGKPIQDPKILVMSEFFGLRVMPNKLEDGIYIVVGKTNEDVNSGVIK